MKLSDIVYPIIKFNMQFGMTVYLKKIHYSNAHRIPKDRPVFFISNHPTAFLEPLVCAALMDQPIYPLVRGDFFQNKTAKTALEALNMIPIYRMRDGGVEGLRKNAETFQYCYDLIADHERVVIMAEGLTLHQKRLSPLQKGAARLALGAAQGRKLDDLLVIPLGANFTAANTFRGEIMIEVGEPIEMAKYLSDYKKDKKSTIDRLTVDMAEAMKRTIVHIEKKDDDALFEKVIPIVRRQLSPTLWPSWSMKDDRFRLEKRCADSINLLSDDEKAALMNQVSYYPDNIALRSDRKLLNWTILILGFPLWLTGALYRTIPFAIGRSIVKRKVKEIEFMSPVRFAMGFLFMLLWSMLMFGILGAGSGVKWIWLPIAMLLVVAFSVIYEDICNVLWQNIQWSRMSSQDKSRCRTIEQIVYTKT